MRLPWPLPALLAWGVAWSLYLALQPRAGVLMALLAAMGVGVLASLWGQGWWRRLLIALGFPLSLAITGMASLPAWTWLLPLTVLLLVYPLNAWRDAPLFPTPQGALCGLDALAPLPPGAAVLDAGCGLGHGLRALRSAYPQARLHGLEWSWPLALLCGLRCPWAHVRRGDIWAARWGGYQLVYLFQRPESMARAAAKAQAEMAPDSWLVSLAFEVPDLTACARLPGFAGQEVWVYRMGAGAAASGGATKDGGASADVTL